MIACNLNNTIVILIYLFTNYKDLHDIVDVS